MARSRPSERLRTMYPSPPKPDAFGSTTVTAKAVATAASTALPPAARISAPAWEASSCADATIPSVPVATCWEEATTGRSAKTDNRCMVRSLFRQPSRMSMSLLRDRILNR